MSRITTTILVMMLLLNGGVTLMESSGLSDDLGVTLAPGIDKTMDDITNNLDEFRTSEGLGETLFAVFASAGNIIKLVVGGAFAAPSMLLNLGFPSWIVVPFFSPMYVLGTLEIVSVFSGRRMI